MATKDEFRNRFKRKPLEKSEPQSQAPSLNGNWEGNEQVPESKEALREKLRCERQEAEASQAIEEPLPPPEDIPNGNGVNKIQAMLEYCKDRINAGDKNNFIGSCYERIVRIGNLTYKQKEALETKMEKEPLYDVLPHLKRTTLVYPAIPDILMNLTMTSNPDDLSEAGLDLCNWYNKRGELTVKQLKFLLKICRRHGIDHLIPAEVATIR